MKLTIEVAGLSLLDELYEIEKQSFKKEAFSKREIAYLLEDYESIGLAARLEGEIAGFVITRIEVEKGETFGHIFTLDVSPHHRRKGIAQRLLGELEKMLKQKGVAESRLEVREDNVAAIGLYLKLGYRKVGWQKRYYGDVHGLCLRKVLLPP